MRSLALGPWRFDGNRRDVVWAGPPAWRAHVTRDTRPVDLVVAFLQAHPGERDAARELRRCLVHVLGGRADERDGSRRLDALEVVFELLGVLVSAQPIDFEDIPTFRVALGEDVALPCRGEQEASG